MDQFPRPSNQRTSLPTGRVVGTRWIPWNLVTVYLGFTVAWTILANSILGNLAKDEAQLIALEAYKDWLFVFISAILLVFLVRRYALRLQQAQAQISAGEVHYRRLIDTASDAIVVMDLESGHFVQHNRQAEQLFEATARELSGLGPADLSPEFQPDGQRSTEKARAYLQEAVEGRTPVFDWMHRSLKGRNILCEIRLLRLPDPNAVLVRGSINDITEHRRAQDALRKSEQQLSLILNNATDMIALYKVEQGGIFRAIAINKTYLKAVNASGFSANERDLVGHTLQEINEGIFHFSPDYSRAKYERFLTVVSSRRLLAYDDVNDTVAGRNFGETVLTPLLDETGVCTSVLYCSRDVTGQRRAAEALARSEENYRTLFEQATDAILLCDSDWRLAEVNLSAVQLTGFSREELLGKDILEIISPEDRQLLRDSLKSVTRERTQFFPCRYLRKDGTAFPGETNARLLQDGRLLAMVRDVSERKAAEEQRVRLEKELRQTQKIQAIGTLAGGIAHDFNNILAAIMGNAQLLKQTLPPDHEGHANVSQILVASNRAKDLVQQILLFSRQREQLRQIMQLEPLINEAIKLISVSLPPQVDLKVVINSGLPAVLADPTQIHQLVVNLCTNAMHAMRSKGGTLTLSLASVSLPEEDSQSKPTLPPGRYVCLMVADTGEGMDAETMEHIYEPFFTTKSFGEGTGLGLAVVHGIVQSHEGVISVASVPGKGTVFRIYFPARKMLPGTSQPWPLRELKPGHGEHILFVDDEVAITEVARIMLTRLGYRVTVFTDPRRAREFLQSGRDLPSLLMTDLSMPGMSGIELIRLTNRERPDVATILLTGYGKGFDSNATAGLNVSEVIHKPFTMEQLSTSVEAAIAKSS